MDLVGCDGCLGAPVLKFRQACRLLLSQALPLSGPPGAADAVSALLALREWQGCNSAAQPLVKGGALRKLELIVEAGLPPMQVVAASRLRELGRFPRNDDETVSPFALDARDVLRSGTHAVLMLFSHRWLQPSLGLPDDTKGTKLRAVCTHTNLCEFAVCLSACRAVCSAATPVCRLVLCQVPVAGPLLLGRVRSTHEPSSSTPHSVLPL